MVKCYMALTFENLRRRRRQLELKIPHYLELARAASAEAAVLAGSPCIYIYTVHTYSRV